MYLVFDIGGTKTRIAYSKDLMTLSEPVIFYTPQAYTEGMQLIKDHITHFSKGHKIKAIMGGIAGPLSSDHSKLSSSPNLPDWINRDLKKELEEEFSTKVYLQNDAALFALGETCFNQDVIEEKPKITAFLTISTGVGGARIVSKKIDPSGAGFEPGHQIIIPDGLPCGCGGKGHLESYISGSALQRIHKRPAREITDPIVWDEVCRYLAIGLNNTIVHWSPEVFILGGGIVEKISLDKVNKYLKEYLTIFKDPPPLIKASLGDLGGLYGALECIRQER